MCAMERPPHGANAVIVRNPAMHAYSHMQGPCPGLSCLRP